MIKIRPITAQINTQKFISNFSSLLARAGMASAQTSPPRPLGPLAPRSTPREPAPPSLSGVRVPGPLLPKEQPVHHHGLAWSRCPLWRGALSHPGLLQRWGGGQEKVGMGMETSQHFALLDPENSTKREVSHPQIPDAPLEK